MDSDAIISRLKGAREFFLMVLKATPPERLTWRPSAEPDGDATTILEQAKHCIGAEAMLRGFIEHGSVQPDEAMREDWASSDAFGASGPAAGATTIEELEKHIADQEALTIAAFEKLTPDDWAEGLSSPWMSGPRSQFAGILATHWDYHTGAVAFIQRLYGDLTFGG